MNIDDAKEVTAISVNGKDIKSLAGIEVFTDLQALSCPNNQLTTLDVSKNLQALDCSSNQLTSLDISKNAVLQNFSCSSNLIKTICVADKVKADANKNWYKDKAATYEVCK